MKTIKTFAQHDPRRPDSKKTCEEIIAHQEETIKRTEELLKNYTDPNNPTTKNLRNGLAKTKESRF